MWDILLQKFSLFLCFSSRAFIIYMLVCLLVSHGFLSFCLLFFILFFFLSASQIQKIQLSFFKFTDFSACSNLLLNPSIDFFSFQLLYSSPPEFLFSFFLQWLCLYWYSHFLDIIFLIFFFFFRFLSWFVLSSLNIIKTVVLKVAIVVVSPLVGLMSWILHRWFLSIYFVPINGPYPLNLWMAWDFFVALVENWAFKHNVITLDIKFSLSHDLACLEYWKTMVIHLFSDFSKLFLQRQYSLSCVISETSIS